MTIYERIYFVVCTVEPLYNEVLGTMKMTLLYQGKKTKSWDQQNNLVITIRGLLYPTSLQRGFTVCSCIYTCMLLTFYS